MASFSRRRPRPCVRHCTRTHACPHMSTHVPTFLPVPVLAHVPFIFRCTCHRAVAWFRAMHPPSWHNSAHVRLLEHCVRRRSCDGPPSGKESAGAERLSRAGVPDTSTRTSSQESGVLRVRRAQSPPSYAYIQRKQELMRISASCHFALVLPPVEWAFVSGHTPWVASELQDEV